MKRYLVALVLLTAGLAGAAAFFIFWPAGLDPVAPSPSQPTGEALLARGKYLTEVADCVACHTASGGRPFAGGRAFQLPFARSMRQTSRPIEKPVSVLGAMQNLSVRCAAASAGMARTCIRLCHIPHTA
jgi:hypothetical protein